MNSSFFEYIYILLFLNIFLNVNLKRKWSICVVTYKVSSVVKHTTKFLVKKEENY